MKHGDWIKQDNGEYNFTNKRTGENIYFVMNNDPVDSPNDDYVVRRFTGDGEYIGYLMVDSNYQRLNSSMIRFMQVGLE